MIGWTGRQAGRAGQAGRQTGGFPMVPSGWYCCAVFTVRPGASCNASRRAFDWIVQVAKLTLVCWQRGMLPVTAAYF